MKIAVIADDLTGANDSGAQFARYGLNTSVLFQFDPKALHLSNAVVIDSDSRSLPKEKAYEKVKSVSEAIKEHATLIYKKIDSTLRGNIGAEIDAIYDTVQPTFMMITPAYPRNGRTVYQGYHFLHGKLLHETELSRDPKCPIYESYIPRLLAKQTKQPIGLIDYKTLSLGFNKVKEQLDRCRDNGIPYIIFDSISEDDLRDITQYVRRLNERVVWVGSAGLAYYLPEAYDLQTSPKTMIVKPNKRPILLVVGSVSQVSRTQLNRVLSLPNVKGIQIDSIQLVRDHQSRVEEIARALRQAENYVKQGFHIALYSSASPSNIKQVQATGEAKGRTPIESSNLIAESLGKVAAGLIHNRYFEAMILTGGDTAKYVCNQIGASGFELINEIEPGVPMAKLIHDSDMYVVTKAGAFGSENTLIQAVYQLQGGDAK